MSKKSAQVRVLLVSALQIYPTLSGGNLRSFALANALARHGIEVFVYSFVGRKPDYLARRPSGTQVWPSGVQEYVNRSVLGFLPGYGSYWFGLPPLWLTAFLRASSGVSSKVLLPRLLRERLTWCDAVISDFPFVYPVFKTKEAHGRLRVLNTHNIEHHLYDTDATWRNRLLSAAVRRVEVAAATHADIVVSCSESDRHWFEQNARIRCSLVVPNGIDPERFRFPQDLRGKTREALGIPDDVRVFLFTASKWGPNQEAFDFLLEFARTHEQLLLDQRIHFLVVGNVTADPIRLPALTATGKVEVVEPYFAAADAAINPIASGAGTNVKMAEFIAARLPVLVCTFGARGFNIEDGRNGFVFEKNTLAPVLVEVKRLFEKQPEYLQKISEEAYADNAHVIDMGACVNALVGVIATAVCHDLRR